MSERTWTVLELVRWTTGFFGEHGIASARLDAEVLLAGVLDCSRMDLYVHFDQPVSRADRATYREMVLRRAKERVPVAYLTGVREFWSLSLRVTPDVLVPRPDTETLVRAALARAPRRVLDVGTGSGCVAIALARELPEASIRGTDVSPTALEVARENAAAAGVDDRVEWVRADLLEGVEDAFDAIVSNLPYVPSAEIERLAPEVQQEPRLALDGGADGLDLVRRLVAAAPARLAPGGGLLLEVGAGQADAVATLLSESGATQIRRHADLAGIDRVIEASFAPTP